MQRLATFDFPHDSDDLALERAWNSFSEALRAEGLRPSEEPFRSTETSVTFRLFVIEHERIRHRLNFDMGRLISAGGLVSILLATYGLFGVFHGHPGVGA